MEFVLNEKQCERNGIADDDCAEQNLHHDGNEYQPDAFVGCAKRFEYANGVYSVEHDDNQACDDWKARNKSHQSKHYGYVGVQQVEPCEMGGIAFAYGW